MTNTKYKLSSIDKAQITAAARKALMVADAHYYAWPTQQQELFRTTMIGTFIIWKVPMSGSFLKQVVVIVVIVKGSEVQRYQLLRLPTSLLG
jgi:hypothetical protein